MYPGECNLMSLTQLVSASKIQFPVLVIFACTHNLYCISSTRSLSYCLCCTVSPILFLNHRLHVPGEVQGLSTHVQYTIAN